MSLTFLFTTEIEADHLHALANCKGVRASPAGTTTSGSFTTTGLSGASVSFTKVDADSRIRVDMHASFYFTVASPSAAAFGVKINGTFNQVCYMYVDVNNRHTQASGTALISGIPAGTYTVEAIWRKDGAGTLNSTSDTQISFAVSEVQE